MNFMFSWQERYPTRSLRSLVRYCSCHSNIKFIPSRHRVISSITRSLQTEIFYKSSVDGTQSRLNENVVWTNSFVICETNLLQEKNKHVICRLRVGPYSKNCDLGLENAALGLRPRAVFSRPRSQFFTTRTSKPANNIYFSHDLYGSARDFNGKP